MWICQSLCQMEAFCVSLYLWLLLCTVFFLQSSSPSLFWTDLCSSFPWRKFQLCFLLVAYFHITVPPAPKIKKLLIPQSLSFLHCSSDFSVLILLSFHYLQIVREEKVFLFHIYTHTHVHIIYVYGFLEEIKDVLTISITVNGRFLGRWFIPLLPIIILIIFFLKGFKSNAGKFFLWFCLTWILEYISLIECDTYLKMKIISSL